MLLDGSAGTHTLLDAISDEILSRTKKPNTFYCLKNGHSDDVDKCISRLASHRLGKSAPKVVVPISGTDGQREKFKR